MIQESIFCIFKEEESTPSKRRRLTNQTGRGDPPDPANTPTFEIVRPLEGNHFILEVLQSRSFKQSRAAREITYRARLRNPVEDVPLNDLLANLHALFDSIIQEARKDYGESGVMRIYISHPNLETAIIVPPTYLGILTPEKIMEHIDNVLYSAGDIPADENIDINAAVVELVQGKGRKALINLETDIISKRSFVKIKNTDNTCLARAIVVGFWHWMARENPERKEVVKMYNWIRDGRRKVQENNARMIMQNIGIPEDRPGLLEDIPKYEDYYGMSIVVLSSKIGNKAVYPGSDKYDEKIFLYHSDKGEGGHFDTITKVNAMMCKQYYCTRCNKGFKERTKHNCQVWCNVCGRDKCKDGVTKRCSDCNKECRSYACYKAHKEQKMSSRGKNKGVKLPSLCEQFWQCPDCGITLKTGTRDPTLHECGESQCKVCNQYFMEQDQHMCYMRAFTSEVNPQKFIFYDFECVQESGTHSPNFVVAHSICPKCESEPVTSDATCSNCGSRCPKCDQFDEKEQEWERYPCKGCGKRQVIFSGKETCYNFCKWLISEQHKNVIAIAHNARGYDAYFIYDYLMQNGIIPEPSIFSGSKIMFMRVSKGLNIRILDSLNFLPMPLANLPKAFGLKEIKKGFFPHFYNTEEHQRDVLPCLPDQKYYNPDGMSKSRRKEFVDWYETNKNEPFDFQKEMKEYCISDVDILLKACWKFRELLRKETGVEDYVEDPEDGMLKKVLEKAVDPFSFLTIASVCMGIFRSKFLRETWAVLTEENALPGCKHDMGCKCNWHEARKVDACTDIQVLNNGRWVPRTELKIVKEKFVSSPIALIPSHGYSGGQNHSKESMEWLECLEEDIRNDGKDISIQHARSEQGEKIIAYPGKSRQIKYRVDGYFELDGKKFVCEYNGCNFHGCVNCYPRDRESTMNDGKSMALRYKETLLKEKRLKELGYEVITEWSCQFAKRKKMQAVKDYIASLDIQDPINVRDCYFGGRTNALVLHKEFTDGERGFYVDFTSLYPDVLKYRRFPVGHPEKITKDLEPAFLKHCDGNCFYANCQGQHWSLPYFGIIKATFIPPQDLIHPVLPVRCNGKLKFPLCFNCASKESKEKCDCSDHDRSFTQTYCTPEVEVAINQGYVICAVHEVLHWPETEMYDSGTQEGGLFTQYINTFLRLKQQASGYPEHIRTEEEKDAYIENYEEHEGIFLEKDLIQKNPGLRSLSKLALNSFYGKFGQRTNMKKTKFITDIASLYNIFTDPSKVVTDFHLMNDDIIEVEYKHFEDFEPLSVNTNVTIAAFCTSWARLKLWSVMNKLGDRVLYHDTDSIIFSVKDGEYIPPLGEYLGQLTNELSCKELGCKGCSGHYIVEFISCGPKNYTFRLNTGEIVCKVRGFSLNYRNSLVINFQSMKEALYAWKNNDPMELVTIKTEIVRDKHQPKVYNRVASKHYGVVYDKRKLLDDFTTIPYGFKQ